MWYLLSTFDSRLNPARSALAAPRRPFQQLNASLGTKSRPAALFQFTEKRLQDLRGKCPPLVASISVKAMRQHRINL
jgi:hypothetical protein